MNRTKSALLVLSLLLMLLVSACIINRRVVSDTPVKSEILGLKLGDVSNALLIKTTLQKEINKMLYSETERIGIGTVVRVYAFSQEPIQYGGQPWHYIDVSLDKENRIVDIRFYGSFEKLEQAKAHFEESVKTLANKYGKSNKSEDCQNLFWTDNTNSVGVAYIESSTITGQNRSFASMYYTNIALADELEKNNIPDV